MSEYEQQARELLEKLGIELSIEYIGPNYTAWDGYQREMYRVEFWRELGDDGRTFTINFLQCGRDSSLDLDPCAADILSTLVTHHPGTLESFCERHNHNPKSRNGASSRKKR
jgi:hypothetical protein